MTTRKIMFCIFLAGSIAINLHWQFERNPPVSHHGPLAFIFSCLLGAFSFPAVPLVAAWHFHYGTNSEGALLFWVVLWCGLFWFFPAGRVQRWFGTFDAFRDTQGRRPPLRSAATFIINELDKRLFGRRKSGGWA